MSFDSSNGMESEPSTAQWLQPCRKFKLKEILISTENFNESFVIGSGGFGKVYIGEVMVGSSHVAAAIKRLDLKSDQGAAEFWAEVEMLSNLRHSHLVSLIGYCNYEREMILVYEYMPNGTLEDHLHKFRKSLSWVDRLKICIGAARGLEYLHHGTSIEFGVIHRDVKSSNNLLHESWAAKISDFGLSKLGPTNQPTTYVNTLVKGTFGYLDPNYFATGKLTRKSDVYAFGVVLFEVLCRKHPVDRSLEYGLATWAQDSIKEGNLKNIVDSDIRGEISQKCLKGFARIAKRCIDYHPKNRPTMTEVIISLESVLSLQQKTNSLLQIPGKSIFTRMVDVFPFNSTGENPGTGFGFFTTRKQKQPILRKKIFDQNGAILLKVKQKNISVRSPRAYTLKELEEATQYFATDMIIGNGASGTVYKGVLPDNRVIAIKKPQIINLGQFDQFINEILILCHINHQNLVKLLGCCLETEVPLIAYEYVGNSNLYQHLHGEKRRLSWDSRLRIAFDTASALAYLHKDTTMSIIHGDVKSANILLDENLSAKIADFGTSKVIIWDYEEVSTLLQGTNGYMDPEYFHSGQVSDKSDVYSFGVVLAELLTGNKPLIMENAPQKRTLATYFINLKRENRLSEIVDYQVLKEATDEQLRLASDLACRCLELAGGNRPSMKQVAMELKTIRKLGKDFFTYSR